MAGSQVPGGFHPILLNYKRVWPVWNTPYRLDPYLINSSGWRGIQGNLGGSPVWTDAGGEKVDAASRPLGDVFRVLALRRA